MAKKSTPRPRKKTTPAKKKPARRNTTKKQVKLQVSKPIIIAAILGGLTAIALFIYLRYFDY